LQAVFSGFAGFFNHGSWVWSCLTVMVGWACLAITLKNNSIYKNAD